MAPAMRKKRKPTEVAPSSKRSVKQKRSGSVKERESKEASVQEGVSVEDEDFPTLEEWNDKTKYTRYKTCQLSGQKWEVGDFIEVAGQGDSGDGDMWLAQILHIRAAGTSKVYCQVEWLYRSIKDLTDAKCRNPPSKRLIHFPEEVVMGEGDHAASIITVQCINDSANVVHFDEANPLQDIPKDAIFFRSVLRSPTEAEIKQAEAAAAKLKAAKKANKLWNAKFPLHEFDIEPSCFCKRRYIPLPLGSEPMVLCPKSSCRQWYHLACVRDAPRRTTHKDILAQVANTGLDYLEADRESHGEYLVEEKNDDSIAVDSTLKSADTFADLQRNPQGIPLILILAAQSYISRGTSWAGIVGDARRVLEARALLRDINQQIEHVEGTPSQSSRAKGRASRIQVQPAPSDCEDRLDAATKTKLKLWLEQFGQAEWGDRRDGEEVFHAECPSCYGVI